ncbi:tetratricopeptide repeat protein [Henriciella litoralis]|uniref:tetratricopeptide repeat protein n=1 Tax=Henriciella litoralis TaxID=568102 RepID=UPI0009FB9BE7|nr:tetratricopeptide repeat protein [Henriciella litoralis]
MSRAKTCLPAVSLTALLIVSACASTGASQELSAEAKIEAAMAEELAPATPEQIAEVDNADPLTQANFWAGEFRKDPTRLDVTIRFTQALRAIGSHERAIEVLSKTIPAHPQSAELHMIMGRALLSENRPDEAAEAFYKASYLNPKDPAAHAAFGLAMDRLERHYDAQKAYQEALDIDPSRVSTLTNFGLSLALSGDLDRSESLLRQAASLPQADSRVRQNLALVLGLQGRFDEMREVDPHAPQRTVDANLDALRAMIAPARDYGALRDDAQPAEAMPVSRFVEPPASEPAVEQPKVTPTKAEQKPRPRPLLRGSLGD